jgi:RHH-type proline utilization regulon transcriptional repressor/proline dehydrogenase/delta 1-pyrroline-5-carboxylate dehydrogenase
MLAGWMRVTEDPRRERFEAALFAGDRAGLSALCRDMAAREGAIVLVHAERADAESGRCYPLEWLVREKTVSINTTAAGGNASLMAMG